MAGADPTVLAEAIQVDWASDAPGAGLRGRHVFLQALGTPGTPTSWSCRLTPQKLAQTAIGSSQGRSPLGTLRRRFSSTMRETKTVHIGQLLPLGTF